MDALPDPPAQATDGLLAQIRLGVDGVKTWEAGYGAFDRNESLDVSASRSAEVLDDLVARLHDNYPFFHPRYAG